jgi:UDP-3-O-[3-hydroxymyristoyl] glucosamine N-acyltransferase
MPYTLAEVVRRFGGELKGDPDCPIEGVGPLHAAGAGEITFLTSGKYQGLLQATSAAAVILSPEHTELFGGNRIVTANPYAYFARVADLLHPLEVHEPGRHPSAVVDDEARVASSAWIGPQATVDAGVHVGERVQIGSGCWIGKGCVIGDDVRFYANVSVYPGCRIGARSVVHAGAVIGADGFGFARDADRWLRIPQIGGVTIGADVSIGANTTIDCGTFEDTVIEDGCILDNLIQIAHNVRIGSGTAMAGCSAVAGSTHIGKRCTLAGRVGVSDHLEIGDDVHIAATSLVSHSIKEPGVYSASLPAEEARQWRKNVVRIRQLDSIARRLKKLEQDMANLTKGNEC